MSEQQSGLLIGAGTKEVLKYLSERNHDAILEIVRDFPLAQSKDIIFAVRSYSSFTLQNTCFSTNCHLHDVVVHHYAHYGSYYKHYRSKSHIKVA